MKIDRKEAIAFLQALGFNKAAEWDNLKLQERLEQVPSKVKEDEVGDEHEELYKKLVKADQEEDQLEIEGGEPEGEEKPKSKKDNGDGDEAPDDDEEEEEKKVKDKKKEKKKDKKAEKKGGKSEKVDIDSLDMAGLRSVAEEMGLKPKGAEAKTENLLRALIRKAMKSKGSKVADEPKDKGKTRRERRGKEKDDDDDDEEGGGKKKDAFGCDPDSIRGKVNAALTDEWQTDEEVAEAAGVTVKQARGRLRRMVRKELAEVNRAISYRLPEGKSKK